MTTIQALVLGLVQGLTEFLPVSSTAHLRIVPALLGWPDPGAAASAVIQFGTLLAVIIYFARDLMEMSGAFLRGLISMKPFQDPQSRLAWFLIIGTVPIAVIGLLFKHFIETTARGLWIIASSLIFLAIILLIAEAYAKKKGNPRTVEDVDLRDTLAVGFGQCLALIPGMSRSGTTIMAGLFRGLTHEAAARFSFLLSIPAVGASGLLELVSERKHLAELGWFSIAVAVFVAFLTGWASIWFLLRYLKTHTTGIFIYYRIALGLLIMVLLSSHVLVS
ncbi:MAG: undecaprenyl-diphosphatase UppP [Acidobacteriota bacterium]